MIADCRFGLLQEESNYKTRSLPLPVLTSLPVMSFDFEHSTLDIGLIFTAATALAADGFDYVLEILSTVVVCDLFAGFDVSLREDPNSAVLNYCLSIGAARVVGIARDVVAAAAINRPPGVYSKEIFAVALVNNLIGKIRSGVLNDSSSLWDWMLRK